MSMRLVIDVEARGGPSLTTVFRPLLAASAAASRGVEANLSGAGERGGARGARATAGAYRTAYQEAGQAAEGWAKRADAAAAAHHRRMLANVRELESEQRRSILRTEAEGRRIRAQMPSAALRTFGGLARSGASILNRATQQGLGVDTDIFSAMGRARETAQMAGVATRADATAHNRTATQADIDATVKAIQDGGDRAKVAYRDLSEGLTEFVGKSADLKTGNEVLGRMGMIAQATGSSVKDLLSAGGDVNRELDDSPDKAERLLAIMRLIAKQGAMGNVEVRDMAKYMGRVSATAFMYEGSKDKNIGILGALAQISMKGGAASAAEATRSAAAFARDLTKEKSLKAFAGAGIDVFADKSHTKLKGPEAIITEFLKKSNGSLDEISKLFRNDASAKIVKGFANIYGSAGGGDKGLAAVHSEFKRFSTTMTEQEVNAQAATALKGDTASAQEFMNEMEKLGGAVGHELTPALKELAPIALEAAHGLGTLVSFGASHPEVAITAAIVASIGKAAIGEQIGKILSSAGPAGLAVGALAMAAAAAAAAIYDYESKSDAAKGKPKDASELVARAEKELKEKGSISRDTIDEIARRRADVEASRAALKTGGVDQLSYAQILASKLLGGGDQVAAGEGATAAAKEMGQEKLDALATKLDALIAAYGKTQRVHVENASELRGPAAGPTPSSARSDGAE